MTDKRLHRGAMSLTLIGSLLSGNPIACGGRGSTSPLPSADSNVEPSTRGGGTATFYALTGGRISQSATGGATIVGSGGAKIVAGSTTESIDSPVMACPGIALDADNTIDQVAACNGVAVEAESVPVDMILLMDRSIGYGLAAKTGMGVPAGSSHPSRWDVLTSAMQALANLPEAATLGASVTFYGKTGTNADAGNCRPSDYVNPEIPMALIADNGAPIIAAMRSLKPAGLSPTVPALEGVYQYAMAEKQKDATREKVVVLFTDGLPTQCSSKSPADVTSAIASAAVAAVPIRTFVVGVGEPNSKEEAGANLAQFAKAGRTRRPPYSLDVTQDTTTFPQQLVTSLLDIANSFMACEYSVTAPSPDWVIDPDSVRFVYRPSMGPTQAIPRVSSAAQCTASANGGWYFDDPIRPSRIIACPCSCANFGLGMLSIVFGCSHGMVIE